MAAFSDFNGRLQKDIHIFQLKWWWVESWTLGLCVFLALVLTSCVTRARGRVSES